MCVVSNGFAAMGIALPGAIGAQLLYPYRRVIAVTGDAGFLMNSQELETAVRYDLPIIILVWRDDGYGVIGWKQQLRFSRTSGVTFGNSNLVDYACSFGAAGFRVESPASFGGVFREALSCGKPAVIDCPVDYGENLRLSNRLKSLVRPHIAAPLSRRSLSYASQRRPAGTAPARIGRRMSRVLNGLTNGGLMQRSASAQWQGNLKPGKGTVSTESGVLSHN